MVDAFENAPDEFANAPAELEECFTRENMTVRELLEQFPEAETSDATRARELQIVAAEPLRDVVATGLYSNLHDNAVYKLGYRHRATILMAYMCAPVFYLAVRYSLY